MEIFHIEGEGMARQPGCLATSLAGIFLIIILSLVGQGHGTAVLITIAVVAIGLFLNAARIASNVRATANWIVQSDRDNPDEPLPFTKWFDGADIHPDDLRIEQAAKIVTQTYGGRAVIARLIDEGYGEIISDDLLAVFPIERAQLIGDRIYQHEARVPLTASLGAFIIGAIGGYKAVRR